MSENTFDLIIIGSGPAGYVGAIRAAQLGLSVACVEKESSLGGTCLNVGCIPSKALLTSSEKYEFLVKKAAQHGIEIKGSLQLNLAKMLERKDDVVKTLTQGITGLFKKNKVQPYQGLASLLPLEGDVHRVLVKSAEGNTKTLKGKRVLLATGSVSAELPHLKMDGENVVSSTEALCFDEVPEHLVVVGGGVIGLELGSVWSRLGSKVSVVEYANEIVSMMDRDVSRELKKELKKQGLEFYLAHSCQKIEKNNDGSLNCIVQVLKTKEDISLKCDKVLMSVGRRANTEHLGLERVGVELDKQGAVVVDSQYQSSIKGIFAVGDVVKGPMLAHKAEEEAVAAVELMVGNYAHVNYNAIPSVVYTHPEVASVGLSEQEAKEKGYAVKTGKFPFLANGRARANDDTSGFVKIVADSKTDRLLGMHIVCSTAGEMIGEAVSVLEFEGTVEDIFRSSHAHPTLNEAIKEAALDVHGRKLNL